MDNYNKIKDKCIELNIDFNQFFILKSLHDNAEDDYDLIKNNLVKNDHKFNLDIEYLCKIQYICIARDKLQLSFIDVIKQQILLGFNDLIINKDKLKGVFDDVENVQSFCSRMYEKFPRLVIPTSKKQLRSGETEFNEKLNRFIESHNFSLETIEKAFDLYIARGIQAKWEYFQTAGFFVYKKIEKGSETSALESYCEEAKDIRAEDMIITISGQISIFDKRL